MVVYNKNVKDVTKTVNQKVVYAYSGKQYETQHDIAFFSYANKIDKLEHGLLGDFDANGLYKLPNEILKQLASLKKVIVKKQNNNDIYLKADCSGREFNFLVKLEVLKNNKMVAKLYLIESALTAWQERKQFVSPIVHYITKMMPFLKQSIKKFLTLLQATKKA